MTKKAKKKPKQLEIVMIFFSQTDFTSCTSDNGLNLNSIKYHQL